MMVSWLLSCTVHWGLADFQLCLLFPGHIPISGTLKLLSPERACTLLSLMTAVGRRITLQAFVWQIEPVAIVHMLKKPYGRALWPCLNYLVVFPFVVKRQSQDGFSTSVLDPQNPRVLKLPINLEPRVYDVTSKQLEQPQAEVEGEAKMKENNDDLCLHISGVAGNELWWMWSIITQVPLLQFLLHSRAFIRCAWIMAYGFQIKQGKPRREVGLFLDGR